MRIATHLLPRIAAIGALVVGALGFGARATAAQQSATGTLTASVTVLAPPIQPRVLAQAQRLETTSRGETGAHTYVNFEDGAQVVIATDLPERTRRITIAFTGT